MFDGEILEAPATIQTNGHTAPAIVGEIETDDPDDNYVFDINLRKMTWGDNMIQARFQLLIETIGAGVDADEEGDDEATRKAKRAERVTALRELLAGFDELTAYLNRVAKVKCNGRLVDFKVVPMDIAKEVMAAISKAQARQGNPKN